jgi:DNA-binding CsgD family transcriptional regulator
MHESEQMVRRALDAGARGYLLKSDLTEYLAKAVRAIAAGKRFLTPKVSEIVLDGFLRTKSEHDGKEQRSTRTTPRKMEIVRLLAQGKSNKEIAAQLGITVRTVETHRAKIMLKLDLHSLADLIHYAIRQGLHNEAGSAAAAKSAWNARMSEALRHEPLANERWFAKVLGRTGISFSVFGKMAIATYSNRIHRFPVRAGVRPPGRLRGGSP